MAAEYPQQATAISTVLTSTIEIAVPTIADAEIDSVAVDTSAESFVAKVGDAVVAIPMVALPTDCIMCGAYVTADDEITVTFAAKEGGAGVTGANKNFRFLIFNATTT